MGIKWVPTGCPCVCTCLDVAHGFALPPAALWQGSRAWCWKSSRGQLCRWSCGNENKSHPNATAFPTLSSPAGALHRWSFASCSGKSFAWRKLPAWGKLQTLLLEFYLLSSSAATREALPTSLCLTVGSKDKGLKTRRIKAPCICRLLLRALCTVRVLGALWRVMWEQVFLHRVLSLVEHLSSLPTSYLLSPVSLIFFFFLPATLL